MCFTVCATPLFLAGGEGGLSVVVIGEKAQIQDFFLQMNKGK